MVNAFLIIIVIFFLVIAGFGAYFYFFVEKPIEEAPLQSFDLNILSDDVTGFRVYANGALYREGKTSDKAAVLIKIPLNRSVIVINKNLEKQDYYILENKVNTVNRTFGEKVRLKLDLVEPGNLTLDQKGVFGRDYSIELDVNSDGYFKDMIICFKWSQRVLYVDSSPSFMQIDNIKNNDKCYDIGKSLDNESINIPIEYTLWGELDEKDYIKVSFIDNEYVSIIANESKNVRQIYTLN